MEETFQGENHSQIIKTIIIIIATVIIIIIIITVAINIMTKIAAIGEPIIPINHAIAIKMTIDNDNDNTLQILCQVSPLSPLYKSVFTGGCLV